MSSKTNNANPHIPKRPRCECCDEVLEAVFMMRQNFETLLQRLNTQVVELRREVQLIGDRNSNDKNTTTANDNKKVVTIKRKAEPNSSGAIQSNKLPRHQPETIQTKNIENESSSRRSSGETFSSSQNRSKSQEVSTQGQVCSLQISDDSEDSQLEFDTPIVSLVKPTIKRPIKDFINIKTRVFPTKPFKTAKEFEDWNTLLKKDEAQRKLLRKELMQVDIEDPDNYIRTIWKNIMLDEAACTYTMKGNVRTNKTAVINYTFTDLFKDCFVARFLDSDADFFIERSMRNFHYAQDRIRKLEKAHGRSYSSRYFESVKIEHSSLSIDDEQSMESMFEDVYT